MVHRKRREQSWSAFNVRFGECARFKWIPGANWLIHSIQFAFSRQTPPNRRRQKHQAFYCSSPTSKLSKKMLSVATRSRNFRSSSMVRCFASKSPPRTNKEPSKSSREKRKKSISGSNSTPREIISDCKPNRFKSKRIKEWKNRDSSQLTNVSPVQPSDFLYNDLRRRSLIENDDVLSFI